MTIAMEIAANARKLGHAQLIRYSASGKTLDEFLQDPDEKLLDEVCRDLCRLSIEVGNSLRTRSQDLHRV